MAQQIMVDAFGGFEQLKLVDVPTPQPGPGQVVVRLTSIGMNHADLMARRGEYRIASGDPPFTPGLEGGGMIEAVGQGVTTRQVGQRVVIGVDVPRPGMGSGGTYRSHYVCAAEGVVPAPQAVPDAQLGALWLTYLTAWSCLIWKQNISTGQYVGLPAASSGVALAAAQIVRAAGAIPIGLTTSQAKRDRIAALDTAAYEHILVTREPDGSDRKWYRDLKNLTAGKGVDVYFDPVAAGPHLEMEITSLAQHGTIWIYGLMGRPGVVDVTPLIRKRAAIRGWVLAEVIAAGPRVLEQGYQYILDGFSHGRFRQHIDRTFKLADVQEAHRVMEQGGHVGKLVLVP